MLKTQVVLTVDAMGTRPFWLDEAYSQLLQILDALIARGIESIVNMTNIAAHDNKTPNDAHALEHLTGSDGEV